jgi:hypothetical protein
MTRDDLNNAFGPASNDTELDIEVGRIATEQKETTGQSEDAATIKGRVLAEGFDREVYKPESTEEDMRLGHESSVAAYEEDRNNRVEAAQAEADRVAAEGEAAGAADDSSSKKSSKK